MPLPFSKFLAGVALASMQVESHVDPDLDNQSSGSEIS
jgi:hypothetical protein